MSAVCPYCRAPVDRDSGDAKLCPGCGTPHHADCFEENGGCTVFGCPAAPADEPKVSLSPGDLTTELTMPSQALVEPAHPERTIRTPAPPPPLVGRAAEPEPEPVIMPYTRTSTLFGAPPSLRAHHRMERIETARQALTQQMAQPLTQSTQASEGERKKRMTFVTLGILLGAFGAHNFYAGYRTKAIAQLLITLLTVGLASPMTWIWAVIDVCTVDRDDRGIRFES